jgi:endonuclease YncB( thermonuclease family)
MVAVPFAVHPPFCRSIDAAAGTPDLDAPETFAWSLPDDSTARSFIGRVSRVYDGDTVSVRHNDHPYLVRLIGIDAPEIRTASCTPELGAVAARTALAYLALGMFVSVLPSDRQPMHDAYGRLLSFLVRQPDGLLLNLEMIRQGWATVPRGFPHELKDVFVHAQTWARMMRFGLHHQPSHPNAPHPSPAGTADASPSDR